MDGLGPVSKWRHSLPEPYYLLGELADDLGVSRYTLVTRCARNPHLAPARVDEYAGRAVWLFTPDEAENLRQDIEARPPPPKGGRPRLWSAAEVAQRKRLRRNVDYWRRTAQLARAQGRVEVAERAEANAARISRDLRVQRPASLD